MRQEVIELSRLGPLPSEKAVLENLVELREDYDTLTRSIKKPITDEEARVLVKIFGPDGCFGLPWILMHLIESAPGWPLLDCLENTDNEWIQHA